MNSLERYFSLKQFNLYILISTSYLLLIWFSKNILINETVFYNSFSEQLTYERSIKLFEEMRSLSWINYVLFPLVLLIKISLITFVLYIGVFFCDIHHKLSFDKIFRIVTGCEIVFVFAGFSKIFWIYFFGGNYELDDINFFYPLSLINLFKISEVNKFWIFPLQTVNMFQVFYILLLSYGLYKIGKIEKIQSDKIVVLSYIPALVFWVVLIMFLSIDSII
jgi:hypothetical protein